ALLQYRQRAEVVQSAQVSGDQPRCRKTLAVKWALPVGVAQQRTEPCPLLPPQFIGGQELGALELPQVAQLRQLPGSPERERHENVTHESLIEWHPSRPPGFLSPVRQRVRQPWRTVKSLISNRLTASPPLRYPTRGGRGLALIVTH